ncbi:hypothetical protein VF04_36735 [Nostoc linckia z7]|uniref:Uncharacterized protein n=1 Tax=Nostoc linckia z7 TaxID=1628745 RepID=A0ABX4KEW1_NOSLI|nr:hypothetical protein [Nostoc linckia]PHJ52036.1 hypothetical protein VF02_37775 [Nostoc linckia z1]PHJ59302.1 hypothetical protein VF05_32440 [Nostoc linckia z3]PHJ63627.1 hypothetical protein VF03_29950 [Nostoc linckia z2]PHJ70431.1 hypothetical protein VF06_37645 [Nostoc linckia z4]PHJ83479.1 hypothetical protein VF04_36735 [Nostoc linckia z7]
MNYEFKGTKEKWELGHVNSVQTYPNDPLKMSTICVVYGTGEEMEANRHLIASAPELLEALLIKTILNTDTEDWEVVGLNGKTLYYHESLKPCEDFIRDFKQQAIRKALNINQ